MAKDKRSLIDVTQAEADMIIAGAIESGGSRDYDKLEPGDTESRVMMFMESGASYRTGTGVSFQKEHPFKSVPVSEVESLLKTGRFRVITDRKVIEEFYKV